MHGLRRLLAMFTALTPRVNQNALDQLVGPYMSIQRLQPWKDVYAIGQAARSQLPSLEARFGAIVDVEKRSALPQKIQETPFYQDGQLLFDALKKLVNDWFKAHSEWCSKEGDVIDKDILFFFERLQTWSMYAQDHLDTDGAWLKMYGDDGVTLRCDGLQTWLAIHTFHVSGFHRHVGMVGDSLADPEWAAPAWVEGERYARPQQALLLGIVSASTGTSWPKLSEDYSFMAEGTEKAEQIKDVLANFRAELAVVKETIAERNEHRPVPYIRFDPDEVETAVAV